MERSRGVLVKKVEEREILEKVLLVFLIRLLIC